MMVKVKTTKKRRTCIAPEESLVGGVFKSKILRRMNVSMEDSNM